MGCQIVSIYEDQVFGKMGYPQQAMQDLIARDIQKSRRKNQPHQNILANHNKIKFLYGFTQSFTASNLQSVIINQKQFLLYNSLNYIVLLDIINRQQYLLPHQQQILCSEINGKYLGTACVGGKITLWDLQQREVRLSITLPKKNRGQSKENDSQISRNCSAIAVTQKLIIVADTSQPSNYVYAFDIQTGKLLGTSIILSIEPTFRGIGFGDHHLVTIGADGVWFSKYSIIDSQFTITKGMFNKFPRTSMTCVTKVGTQYIITGGVDGYIFIWSNGYQCKVVYRIFDFPLMSMIINQKNLIVSNTENKAKCLTYKLLKHFKEDDKEAPPTIELQFTVIANYQTLSAVQSMAFAKLNSDFCYLQTRNGQLISRIVPDSQMHEIRKVPLKESVYCFLLCNTFKNNNNFRKSIIVFHESTIQQNEKTISSHKDQLFLWSVSFFKQKKTRKHVFHLVKLSINDIQKFNKGSVTYYKKLQIQQQASYSIRRKILKNSPYAFSPYLQHICHVKRHGQQNNAQKSKKLIQEQQQEEQQQDLVQAEIPRIVAFQCQQTILTDQLMNEQKKQFLLQSQNFTKDKVDAINYVKVLSFGKQTKSSKILLIIQQGSRMIIFNAWKSGYKQLKVVQDFKKYRQSVQPQKIQINDQKDNYQLTWDRVLKQWTAIYVSKPQRKQKILQPPQAMFNRLKIPLNWQMIQNMHKGPLQSYFASEQMGLFTVANGKVIQWKQP